MSKVFEYVKSGLSKCKLPPLDKVLSEPDGTASFARYSGFLIILFTLGWVTYVVIKTTALPDLTNPAIFVTLGSGTHYGINQARKVVSAWKGNPDPQDAPQGGNNAGQ